ALALGLGGLWWLVSRPPAQVWWALPFFLGAFYTKQTAIAAAVAAIGWLLVTRRRTGLAFGAAYALGAALPSIALNWATNGGYFYHLLTLHDLPWFPDRFALYVGNFLTTYWWLLLFGVLEITVLAAVWL